MKTKISSCGWCGSEATLRLCGRNHSSIRVECQGCSMAGETVTNGMPTSGATAIELWNKENQELVDAAEGSTFQDLLVKINNMIATELTPEEKQ